MLFPGGLPWVFVFGGLKNADDGTVVVVGDLGAIYDRNLLLYRGVLGFAARQRGVPIRARLAALPANAPEHERNAIISELRAAEVLDEGSLTFPDDGHIVPLDFYGNVIKPAGGKIVVPLNGLGYFLRTDGSPGSFAKLLAAISAGRIEGYEPVEIVAHDLLARVEAAPELRITLTNILNRPIQGTIEAKLGDLKLEGGAQKVALGPHETRAISWKVAGGAAAASNSYPLGVTFDAGPDGRRSLAETLHVNVIRGRKSPSTAISTIGRTCCRSRSAAVPRRART